MIMFTCDVCQTKQSKFFTKQAYHKGVVLVRCDGCSAVHLLADNLGWYGDEKKNVETMMKEKGQEVTHGKPSPELLAELQEKVKKTHSKFEELQKKRREEEEKEESENQTPN